MKFVLINTASTCLTQNAAHGHAIAKRAVPEPISNALAQVTNATTTVGSAILAADRLLKEYSDNSTDYMEAFRVDILAELNATYEKYQGKLKINDTISIELLTECTLAQRPRAEVLLMNATREVFKCGVTKIKQFVDMNIDLELLGNETLNIGPNTNAKVQDCDQQGNDIARYGCMATALAAAATKVTEISVTVSATVTAATAIFGTFQSDLSICAAAKVFGFRQEMLETFLQVGVCVTNKVNG